MYISNDKIIDLGVFNVDLGYKIVNFFGLKFIGNLIWIIIFSIVWEFKLEYFIIYDIVIVSWENIFNFVLNCYLFIKLFVYVCYDDGVILIEDNKSYF